MIFNSWAFILFFAFFYCLYTPSNFTVRKYLLIAGGLFFYGWWDERFLVLLLASTAFNFGMGLKIDACADEKGRTRLLTWGVVTNLLLISVFKYAEFIIQSFGLPVQDLGILLPIGISFYTFQAISYLVDVRHRKVEATSDFGLFFLYKCYFPQLVAGPIERPSELLPQLRLLPKASVKQIQDGLWLILWGFFLKIVVADNLAMIVDRAFTRRDYEGMSGYHVATAVVAFAFQIYGDFAGYSKIARGVSKLLGIELIENFNHPYLSKTPSEFWTRWHISLSAWLRDYLYIPLGGNRISQNRTYFNLMTTMLLGGLWHGASWLFVIWGAFHGLLLIVQRLLPALFRSRIVLFIFICIGWMIFRAETFPQLVVYAKLLFTPWDMPPLTLTGNYPDNLDGISLFWIVVFGGIVLVVDWLEEWKKSPILVPMELKPFPLLVCALFLLSYIYFGASSDSFIYFQF